MSLKLGKRLKSFNAHVDLAFRPPFSSSVSKTDFDFIRIVYFYSLSLSYGSKKESCFLNVETNVLYLRQTELEKFIK